MESIFVLVASYRDPECKYTIRDLFAKAAHPEKVKVGLNWQYAEEDQDKPFFEGPYQDQIRLVRHLHTESKGACWARAVAQSLYAGEDFYLSLDAHMRFAPGWDSLLIEIHNRLRSQGYRKPVISFYPPGYSLPDEIREHHLNKVTPRPMLLKGKKTGIVVNSRSVEISEREPFLHAVACAGFLFAQGSVVTDIPYDPHLYFYGEEITMAARLWTSGYDLFHPGCALAHHLYRRQRDPESGARVYRTVGRHQVDRKSSFSEELSYRRVRHLLAAEASREPAVTKELGRFGLGSVRSLHQFSKYTGIGFRYATVSGMGRLGVHSAEGIPLGRKAEIKELERAEVTSSVRVQACNVSQAVELLSRTGASQMLDLGCSWAPWLQDANLSRLRRYVGISVDRVRAHSLSVYFEGEKRVSVRWGNCADEPLEWTELVFDGGLGELLSPKLLWQILGSIKRCGAKHLAVLGAVRKSGGSWLSGRPYYMPEPVSRLPFGTGYAVDIWEVHDPRFQVEALPEQTCRARRVLLQLLFESVERVRLALNRDAELFQRLVEASLDVQRKDAQRVFGSLEVLAAVGDSGKTAPQALSLWWAIRRTNIREVKKIAGQERFNVELALGYVEMQAIAWTFFSEYRHWYPNQESQR